LDTGGNKLESAFQAVMPALFQLHGHVLEAADLMSADFGLTGARWQVLRVAARQPLTVSQIARRLGLKRQSVQRTVNQLSVQRLVSLEPNVNHLRASLVSLSAEGRRVLAALDARQRAWLARCLEGNSPAGLLRLARSLQALTVRVEVATERERAARTSRTARPAAGGRRRRPRVGRPPDQTNPHPGGEPA
jgi:DNA-binding MarR family transcriptional regulator